MRNLPRLDLHRILFTLILGVAVLLSGMAHKMPTAQDAALAGFVISGGDLADICDADGDMKMTTPHCAACYLVGAAVLADPTLNLVAAERIIAATILIPSETRASRTPRDPALGGRAPPLA